MKRLLPLLALLCTSPSWATIALVGTQKTCVNSSITTVSATLNSVAANDFISVVLVSNNPATLNSVVDTNGTVSTAVTYASSTSHAGLGIYYIQATAAGTHQITATWSTSTSAEICIAEYSGVATSAAFDTASPVAFAASTSISTASISPAQSGELIVFGVGAQGTTTTFSAFTNSFVVEGSNTGTAPATAWADLIQATAASVSGGATSSTTAGSAAAIAAFKPAGGSTTCPKCSAGFFGW